MLFPSGERRGEAEADEGGAGEAPLKALKAAIAAEPIGKAARRQGIGAVTQNAECHEDRAQPQDLPVNAAQRGINELRQEGEKEKCRLGIEKIDDEAVAEDAG